MPEEDQWAEEYHLMLACLVKARSSSLAQHSFTYPGLFAKMASNNQETQLEFLKQLQLDFQAWQEAGQRAAAEPCWAKVVA